MPAVYVGRSGTNAGGDHKNIAVLFADEADRGELISSLAARTFTAVAQLFRDITTN